MKRTSSEKNNSTFISSIIPRFLQVVWEMNKIYTNYPRVKLVWAISKVEEKVENFSSTQLNNNSFHVVEKNLIK